MKQSQIDLKIAQNVNSFSVDFVIYHYNQGVKTTNLNISNIVHFVRCLESFLLSYIYYCSRLISLPSLFQSLNLWKAE